MPNRKLVILSYAFAPSIGGIETVGRILARVFARRGYQVVVITHTPGGETEAHEPYRVLRRPAKGAFIAEIRGSDIVLQSNISLRLGWPLWLLFPRKPFVLVVHTPISRSNGRLAFADRLKRALLKRAYFLCVSKYLADTIQPGARVIHNPYEDTIFRQIPGTGRTGDLLFVGRLVPAKGPDNLLRGFAAVLSRRPQTTLSIVGSGPEERPLRDLARSLGIEHSVHFLGPSQGSELAEIMNRHKILVIPSRPAPPEALGIVAVEGIACGCVPVASRMGGLPEAVGEAGVLFEEGNCDELAGILLRLLDSPALLEQYRARGPSQLTRFQPERVADAYEAHFAACGLKASLEPA